MSRFERPLRIVKRFGELLKRGPSERDVATSDAGTQTICLIQSSSTQTATCSPRFKALQQQNSSHKSQSQQSASHQNQSISTQSSSSVSNSASANFFHPNIRVAEQGEEDLLQRSLPQVKNMYLYLVFSIIDNLMARCVARNPKEIGRWPPPRSWTQPSAVEAWLPWIWSTGSLH